MRLVPEIFISAELVLNCVPVNDVGVEIVLVGMKHDYSNHPNRSVTGIKPVKWKYFNGKKHGRAF